MSAKAQGISVLLDQQSVDAAPELVLYLTKHKELV